MYSNVISGIAGISRGLFVFSHSRVNVSVRLTNVGSLPLMIFNDIQQSPSQWEAPYISETGRLINTILTKHKRATRDGDANNHIAVRSQLTNHKIDWDSAQC